MSTELPRLTKACVNMCSLQVQEGVRVRLAGIFLLNLGSCTYYSNNQYPCRKERKEKKNTLYLLYVQ